MAQGNYSNFDKPPYSQPYEPPYYAPQLEDYKYQPNPAVIYNDYNQSNKENLNEPLIENNPKKYKFKVKTIIGLLIVIICFAIEIFMIFYIRDHTYFYDYCYWKFNLERYTMDEVRKNGRFLGIRGNIITNFYRDIHCDEIAEPFPECPGLCEFAENMMHLEIKNILRILKTAEVPMVILAFIYFFSLFTQRPKMSKLLVSFVAIPSFILFLAACIYSILELSQFDFQEVDNDKYADVDGYDGPKNVELKKEVMILIGLIIFMLIYRTVLIILAK